MFIENKLEVRRIEAPGFSLIEMVIALALLAFLASLVFPRITKPPIRETFIKQLNSLLVLAYNHAIMSGKAQRLFFDFKKRTITIEEATGGKKLGQDEFTPVTVEHLKTSIEWPESFALQSFYINEKFDAGIINTIYFMIMPQGYAQRVTINIQDTRDETSFALVLNPFLVQFVMYDEFQKV